MATVHRTGLSDVTPVVEKPRYGHSVDGGRVRYTSVSSITTFDPGQTGGCHRRWYFEKVEGRKPPETKAQAIGTNSHDEIRHYTTTGEDVLGQIVRPGKHLLVKPGADLIVERDFGDFARALAARDAYLKAQQPTAYDGEWLHSEIQSARALDACGVPVLGAMDLRHRRGEWITNEGEVRREADPEHTAEVVDYKTSSSIADWAKPAHHLIGTVQMPGYGEATSREWPDIAFMRLSHIYFGTRRREAEKRSALVPIEAIHRRWREVESVVSTMFDVAREDEVAKVEANPESCTAYRGCPHAGYCPKTREQLIVDLLGKKEPVMSLFGSMQKSTPPAPTNGEPSTAPAAAPSLFGGGGGGTVQVPTEDPVRRMVMETEKARLAAEDATLKVQKTYGNCGSCGQALTQANVSMLSNGTVKHLGCPAVAAILPPDATKPDFVSSAAPLAPEVIAAIEDPEIRARAEKHAAVHRQQVASAASTPAQKISGRCPRGGDRIVLTVEIAMRRKFVCDCGKEVGLKPVEEAGQWVSMVPGHNIPKAEEPAISAPAVATAPAVDPRQTIIQQVVDSTATAMPAQSAAVAVSSTGGVHLFVDVIVDRGVDVRPLEDYYLPIVRSLEASEGAAEIRCAPNDSALGFGKWRGVLAAVCRAKPPLPGAYVVRGLRGNEVAQVVVDALAPTCQTVVRGVQVG